MIILVLNGFIVTSESHSYTLSDKKTRKACSYCHISKECDMVDPILSVSLCNFIIYSSISEMSDMNKNLIIKKSSFIIEDSQYIVMDDSKLSLFNILLLRSVIFSRFRKL